MKEYVYKYKDGRYLKVSYMGDGEYELYLVKNVSSDCVFNNNWSLREILSCCDSVYDENDEYIADTLEESDFNQQEVEVKFK